jgi:hypothetical protein
MGQYLELLVFILALGSFQTWRLTVYWEAEMGETVAPTIEPG